MGIKEIVNSALKLYSDSIRRHHKMFFFSIMYFATSYLISNETNFPFAFMVVFGWIWFAIYLIYHKKIEAKNSKNMKSFADLYPKY